jgi:AraC-like DNA-binding protein
MYEIFDDFCWTKERQIITQDRHRVPGLRNISHFSISSSGAALPVHFHSNLLEIHCLVKGTRFSQIQVDDEIHSYHVKGNQCLITYPLELHGSGNELQAPCEFYAFQIDLSKPDDLLGLNRDTSTELYRQLISLPSRQIELGPQQFKEIIQIFNLFAEQTPLSSMRATQYLAGFLLGMSELTPIFGNEAQQIEAPIRRSLDYLSAHITEPIRLSSLANAAGYSLSHFKAKFKETVGVTPAEYVTMQKIELAKRRLTEGNESITELAYNLGYSSSNYFCSVFKKMMNCSPQNYRLRYRNKTAK